MPDLRRDPICGRWVIIAADRARRPQEYVATRPTRRGGPCPFCAGNEDQTPDEVLAIRDASIAADGPGWRVRVVPNKFPALTSDGAQPCRETGKGLFQQMPGLGLHEVIVESPDHLTSTSQLSQAHLAEVLNVYRQRLLAAREDRRLAYALVFKNVGSAAGASLEHLHSQLLATPLVPTAVLQELHGAGEYYDRRGACVFCAMIAEELAAEQRIVVESPDLVALCPFASRVPLETWILPRRHASHYEDLSAADLEQLSGVLRQTIARLETVAGRPAYNYLIHTSPFDTSRLDHYHWHIEIIPRMAKLAGFEWGGGCFINPVPPEEAAGLLRQNPGGLD